MLGPVLYHDRCKAPKSNIILNLCLVCNSSDDCLLFCHLPWLANTSSCWNNKLPPFVRVIHIRQMERQAKCDLTGAGIPLCATVCSRLSFSFYRAVRT